MADGQPDLASQWKSFDQDKRDRLLSKMTPEQKRSLAQSLQPKSPGIFQRAQQTIEGWQEMPTELQPQTEKWPWTSAPGQRPKITEATAGLIGGLEQLPAHPLETIGSAMMLPPLPSSLPWKQVGQVNIPGTKASIGFNLPDLGAIKQRVAQQWQFVKEHPAYTAGQLFSGVVAGELAGSAPETLTGFGRVTGRVVPQNLARTWVQKAVGAGERFQTPLVEQYGQRARLAREATQIERLKHQAGVGERAANVRAAQGEAQAQRTQIGFENEIERAAHEQATQDYHQHGQALKATRDARQRVEAEHRQNVKNMQDLEATEGAAATNEANKWWRAWRDKTKSMTTYIADKSLRPDIEKLTKDYPEVQRVLSRLTPTPDEAAELKGITKAQYDKDRAGVMQQMGWGNVDYESLPDEPPANAPQAPNKRAVDRIMDETGQTAKLDLVEAIKGGDLTLEQVHQATSILGRIVHDPSPMMDPFVRGRLRDVWERLRMSRAAESTRLGAGGELSEGLAATSRKEKAFGAVESDPKTQPFAREKAYTPEEREARLQAAPGQAAAAYSPALQAATQQVERTRRILEAFPTEEEITKDIYEHYAKGPPVAAPPKVKPAIPSGEDITQFPHAKPPAVRPQGGLLTPYTEPGPAPNLNQEISQQGALRLRDFNAPGTSPGVMRLTIGGMLGWLLRGGAGTFLYGIALGDIGMAAGSSLLARNETFLNWLGRGISPQTEAAIARLPAEDQAAIRNAMAHQVAQAAQTAAPGTALNISPSAARFLGGQNVAFIKAAADRAAKTAAGARPIPATPLEAKRRANEVRQQTQTVEAPTPAPTEEAAPAPVIPPQAAAKPTAGAALVPPGTTRHTILTEQQLEPLVTRNSIDWGLDKDYLYSIIRNESGGNVGADSPGHKAQGLMQLAPDTWKAMGIDPWDPVQNMAVGSAYLSALLKRYNGRLDLAAAAYNSNWRWVDHYKGVPPFAETQKYVRNVMADYNRRRALAGLPPTQTITQPSGQ